MSDLQANAAAAARIVVDGGAVYTRTNDDPFFFTSGWASPIFIDIKRLISHPAARERLVAMSLEVIDQKVGRRAFDLVAGCELAGVPFATMIADRLGLPLVVVRKQGKGFGRLAQFEGTFDPGARALLVDDLATDGFSKVSFKSALERAEASVVAIFVLLNYAIFPVAPSIVSLLTVSDVLAAAESQGGLDPTALTEVRSFIANAPRWSRHNGGIGTMPQSFGQS
jgi:orotate phosphoribosyltransferase